MFKFLSFGFLFLAMAAAARNHQPKPVISNDQMTSEQVAIYRAVLENYTKGTEVSLNISNLTQPFRGNDEKECLKGIELPPDAESKPAIHRLDPAVALGPKMALVDPNQQNKVVKQNDPGNRIHNASESGRPLSDKDIEDSVKQAFSTALFTFSEIAFNQEHTRAAVQYSFYCGRLCANGGTLVLAKESGKWKIVSQCSSWIS
jgi:hypothetical protein